MISFVKAAESGDLEQVKVLISDTKNINRALHYAAEKGHLDIVKYLISNGAGVSSNNNCAVRWASFFGHLDIIKYLVLEGADILADDNRAIRWSANRGYLDVTKYLALEGADIRSALIDGGVSEKSIIDFLLSRLVLEECDYSIKSDLYKILPDDNEVKKLIDRIIAMRALASQRLHKSLMPYDITITCYDP